MIVITTPTGNIGHQLLETIVESGESVRVIARDPTRLPETMRTRIEVVQGSHGDADVVNTALAGADALFWLPPPNLRAKNLEAAYLDVTRPVCAAIRDHGVKHVVSVSALGRGLDVAGRAGFVTASLAMDDMIAATGVNFRALTMPSFMENILRQVGSIRDLGLFFGPISPDRKLPTCATRDIASAAARLLLDRSWTGQGAVAVLGPEDISFNDMAAVMSEVLGKSVRFQQIPGEAFKARLLQNGVSEAMAQGYLDMTNAKNEGLDNAEPRTPQSTSRTSFRQWCEEVLKPAVCSEAA